MKHAAALEMPARRAPECVMLRLRHPEEKPVRRVTVNGKKWADFDPEREVILLRGLQGTVRVEAAY